MSRIYPLSLIRNNENHLSQPTIEELRDEVACAVEAVIALVEERAVAEQVTFREFEQAVRALVFAFGRAVLVLFLGLREQHLRAGHRRGSRFEWLGRSFRPAPAIGRNLTTMFGVVRYFRTYMREVAEGQRHGFHPLDVSVGLGADRFSWNVLAAAVRMATKLSFADARSTMAAFVPDTPSTEVIEQSVLGFGRHTAAWLAHAPVPEDDGEVLVIQFDGKGAPTATEREMRRRRGKRRKSHSDGSPRHRGRRGRGRYPSQPRRKKGDKSKNAKMATMVVMYTLRRKGTRRLEGPVNRRLYASFGSKKHAFEVARRMADRRSFQGNSGKLVQVVTDGDNDLARLCQAYFPEAEHTVDYWHLLERIWAAGKCFHQEDSVELHEWVDVQKKRLFDDAAEAIVAELRTRLEVLPKTGPGNKGRRERLDEALKYINKRLAHISYGSLRRRDLEVGSGAVEGAVKHVIGRRCDHGGMRWLKERVEAVLQLRCIEVNGEWDAFESFVHQRLHTQRERERASPRLQTNTPMPLPQAA
jgi:hypothetical protein